MAKITANLDKVEKAMQDQQKKEKHAPFLRNVAIEAIMHGLQSDQGKIYMSMFADNKNQLDLLTTPSDEGWLRQAQAYMIANPICAIVTDTQVANGINKAEMNNADSSEAAEEQEVLDMRPPEYWEMVKFD